MRDLAVDDRVVVGERDRLVPVGAQTAGDGPQRRRAAARSGRSTRIGRHDRPRPGVAALHRVAAGADDHRSCTGHGCVRVGAALRIAVRELHPVVQPGVASLVQGGARPLQDGGRGDTDAVETDRGAEREQLVEVLLPRRLHRYASAPAQPTSGSGVCPVARPRHQPGRGQEAHGSHLGEVEHQRSALLVVTVTDERDDAVGTRYRCAAGCSRRSRSPIGRSVGSSCSAPCTTRVTRFLASWRRCARRGR